MENVGVISQLFGLLERIWRYIVPAKPKLSFEAIEAEHWYNKDDDQSGLSIKMFIINRGNKPTTIRDINITLMNPDHLEYHRPMWKSPIDLPVGKDTKFSYTFFFRGAHLRYGEVKYTLEFKHTEGVEEVEIVSTLSSHLDSEYDSGTRLSEPIE